MADDARRALGIPPARLDVVVSGVDTDLWKPDATQRRWLRQKLGLQPETRGVAEDTPILVAAGRVERGKGFHLAIDSLAALREFEPAPHLVICGAGSAVGWLRERAAAAGVSHRVHFAGFVEPPLLARTFQGADALLMPSMAHEALPLTLLQALATGLPAIASDVGGIPTAVQHGENGLLLPLGDVEALASAVRALLADPERRQQMSAGARPRAVARFSLARMVGEIENILRRRMSGERVSAIIPSRDGQVDALRQSLSAQTRPPDEIVVVVGVSPNGLARNEGVARSHGDILLFIDDDALPGDAELVARVVSPLLAGDERLITGAAKLIPPDSSRFQRWVAREVPRIEHTVVAQPLESNPRPAALPHRADDDLRRHPPGALEALGGFNPTLRRGVDTEFFVQARRAGFRLLLVPHAWTWHPAPPNLRALWRKHFLYGAGHAQELAADPARARGLQRRPLLYLLFRTAILLPNVFVPFSYNDPRWRLGFRPLKALTSYAAALGFVWQSLRQGRQV